jgi:magnesium-transporting ATPase (P-type)
MLTGDSRRTAAAVAKQLGLDGVEAEIEPGGKVDYDAPIAGLRAVDRHTLELKLAQPNYTLLERLAVLDTFAVAREVVEAAGDAIMQKLESAAISRIEIERTRDKVRVDIHTARPGIVIGRRGAQADELRALLRSCDPNVSRHDSAPQASGLAALLAACGGHAVYFLVRSRL